MAGTLLASAVNVLAMLASSAMMECAGRRRLLLVGLMQIMVESGSALQIVLGTAFSVVFLLFQVQSSPYVSLHDDHLSTSCSFALSTIFLTSIAFKYSSLTDLRDIQEKMSEEQRQIYVMDSSLSTILLFLSIFGCATNHEPNFVILVEVKEDLPQVFLCEIPSGAE